MKLKLLQAMVVLLTCIGAQAQVNSGSNGSDGAFNPTTSTVIDMADHPDGIYHYTSVNISNGVTVTFIPNANNTPVVWLVQSNCVVNGIIELSGLDTEGVMGGRGGPGGYRGGNGELELSAPPSEGAGPGGGRVLFGQNLFGGNASFATIGIQRTNGHPQHLSGEAYGNDYALPLIGGSGGGGSNKGPLGSPVGYDGVGLPSGSGGGGGGGAMLIVATDAIDVNGTILALGGGSNANDQGGGGGSGGAIRFVAVRVRGGGNINCSGGLCYRHKYVGSPIFSDIVVSDRAGAGRLRIDAFSDNFNGTISAQASRGFQPIIIPPPNQAVSLAIQSVGGIAVAANPTGASTTPDVVVPSAQQNPVSIVVRCVNIPLNTDIIVDVKPANGPTVRAVGLNNSGTQASSTATVSVTMPRGAGTIQAKAVSGISGSLGASSNNGEGLRHYAQVGLTADGEFFAKMEITATLGSGQQVAYITESGKRFVLPHN